MVALDTKAGRLEATTDAEGRATFEGFEWSGESVDVTIGALDYVMMSRLGLVEADTNEAGEIELEIHALGVSDSAVEISGPICVGSARLGSGPRTTSGRALAWAASTPW